MKPPILFTYLVFLLNSVNLSTSVQFCPHKCTCVRNKIVCLHQDLLEVPPTPSDTISLDLRFNKIQELIPGSLNHLEYLRSLLLNDNELSSLRAGVFDGLAKLKYLYLYRNKIRHIDADVFKDLIHLEQLYLHVNEIHYIDPKLFLNMPRLERLYLHNNDIRRIPPGSFNGLSKLHRLRLDSNALVCDCSMLWLVRMMSTASHMQLAATCYEPPAITGTSLASMTEADFNCQLPEFTAEPEDIVVNFGDNAMFTCVATGEPVPKIIWLRDSNEVPIDSTRYEVLNNGSLMVHDTDYTDDGVFECMAKNPMGEVHSKPARMTVSKPINIAAPQFTVLPKEEKVRIGQTFVIFDCSATGTPKPHIAWLFNGERLLLSDRVSIQRNVSLRIENVEKSDAGLYTCQAENIHGRIRTTVALKVNVPPSFIERPISQNVSLGDYAEFICKANGVPKPTITWHKNSSELAFSENIILRDSNQNLTITEVNEDDDSLYLCRAENSEGVIETSAKLNVELYELILPHILLKPEDTDAFKGTTVQLPCEVESEPTAVVQWRKDGSRITVNNRFSITVIGNLIINNVTFSDSGRYECTAFNEYGRDSASAFLTINDHTLPTDVYVNIALTEAERDIDQAISRTMADLLSDRSSKVNIQELYRITRFPNAPAREVARAAEVYERALAKIKDLITGGKNLTSVEPFFYQNILSNEHLDVIARLSGCVAHRDLKDCSDMCYHSKYRTFDGTCNNFENPFWGSSLSGFRRILFPIYENGFSQPVGWNKNIKYNGYQLPSARMVSSKIITTSEISEDIKITHMVMQWGQWLDHDLDHALPSVSSQTWDGVDCKKTCEYAAPCFPIEVPHNDSRIKNRRCIDFIRTSAVCGSGMTSVLFGALQAREQINQLTSFIDASQVYGFEDMFARDLRDLTNDNGLLRIGAIFPGKKPLLPTTGLNSMDCRRNLTESTRNCFVSGDIRANEQIGLAAMHTIWMREHNRVAHQLKLYNQIWDGDKVFHEARKIVGAQIQHITYKNWLPIILGPEGYKNLGKYSEYNPDINPSISNVFATAALRFGHSLINPLLHRYDENFEPIAKGHLLLRDAFFSPWRLVDEGGVDPLLRGMFATPAKLKTPTQNLNSELTETLFHTAHAVALDLAAMNIQRGRDHGIPPYTKFRQICNMSEVNDFDDLATEISDEGVRDKLKELYGSVHNIDVWVGGILEDQVEDGKVGPLFRCLLIEQFIRLRDGDRFWYENHAVFKPEQLRQIKRVTLARVLCDNGDNIDTIGENVFLLPEVQEGLISCDDLPKMDLRYWADCETCNEDIGIGDIEMHRTRRQATIREDDRFITLKTAHENLDGTVHMLKKRIEYLEENCKIKP